MTANWQQHHPAHRDALTRLHRLLPRLRGFRMLILQYNNPVYRNGIITTLNAPENNMRTLDMSEHNDYLQLERLLIKNTGVGITNLIELENLNIEEQARTFKGLNYHREMIARACQHTLLFWLSEPLIQTMMRDAADFWAWREQVFDFSLPTNEEA